MIKSNFKYFEYIKQLGRLIIDILFPKECLRCGQPEEWLCPRCLNKIKYNLVDECVVCRQANPFGRTHNHCRPKSRLDGMIAAGQEDDKLLHDLIYKYKYNFIKDLANPLAQTLINKILRLKQDGMEILFSRLIVAPVPLHPKRLRWRGFNQAALLGQTVAEIFDWQFSNNLIIRQKYTKPQMKLKRSRRLANTKGAFTGAKIDGISFNLSGKNVLLVDDILTTGATMNECAKILKAGGAGQVWGLVLSRG